MINLKLFSQNRIKTSLMLLSMVVAISSMFLITAIANGVISMYSTMLKTDGDIIITQAKISDTFFSEVDTALMSKIDLLDGVVSSSAMILGASPIEHLPISAVYGASENRYKNYHLTSGNYPKKGEVILGKNIASLLNDSDEIMISNSEFIVSGIYENGLGFEDGGVVITLEDAGEIFKKSASILIVNAKIGVDIESLIKKINLLSPDIEAKSTSAFVDNYNQFKIIETSSKLISILAFFMGLVGVISLMSISVNERKEEFGILRAIGKSRLFIVKKLIFESSFLWVVSFLISLGFSFGLIEFLKNIEKFQGYINGDISNELTLFVALLSYAMAVLGSIVPAYFAAKTDPFILAQRG